MPAVMEVPYVNLVDQHAGIKAELMQAVSRVIDGGQFILGEEVAEFERSFAELCGSKYAVGVNSGTDALILALKSVGIGPGDEVVTVPNSFVASTSAICLLGAVPVFVDVGDDYNINPDLIESSLTAKTKAIMPVHLTGRPCAMDRIGDIARRRELYIIEDAAQAVEAAYDGKKVGAFGAVGCFSLHPLKTLNACGDGGVLTTDDEELYQRLLTLRNLGLKTRDNCVVWSHNSRLDTIQAAMLLVKLNYLKKWTSRRRENADLYKQMLEGVAQVRCPEDGKAEFAVYHTFVVEVEDRDELQRHLASCNVGTAVHYPVPIHLSNAGQGLGYRLGDFPNAERQAQVILSLPIHAELNLLQIEYVCDCIRSFYNN